MPRPLRLALPLAALLVAPPLLAQPTFDGLGLGLGNLSRLSRAKTRSISPENFTGEKGKGGMAVEGTGAKAARDLGQGWKVSPSVRIKGKTTFTMADVAGQGAIQHIWMTPTGPWRYLILRFYWDGEEAPSVEVPVGDFFASGWGGYAQISSLAVCVNPGSAFNCYWQMPFRKSFRITAENVGDDEMTLYYQIDYALADVPKDAAYFHAQFRRVNPLPEKEVYTILDGVRGLGHYVGTYLAWGVHSTGWWGEGEIKFYLDGDREFPTIAGRGPRTTSAAPTTSRTRRRSATRSSRPRTPASPRWCGRTGSTTRSSGSASTAGTSWTPCGSSRTCGSPSRRSAGAPTGATSCSGTTSRRWPTGTRPSPTRRSRRCRPGTRWSSSRRQDEAPVLQVRCHPRRRTPCRDRLMPQELLGVREAIRAALDRVAHEAS